MTEPDQEVSLQDLDRAPVNLEAAGPPDPAVVLDLRRQFTVVSEENFALKQEIEALKKRVNTAEILDALIAPYAGKAFTFMCVYCVVVASFLLLSGANVDGFHLDTQVLALMVGSTAVTVIGLVGMVLTGIFVGARHGK